jgi:hypothetical protein
MGDGRTAEAARAHRLAALWREAAGPLSAPALRGLADEVERHPWGEEPTAVVTGWIATARALAGWFALADDFAVEPEAAARWDRLRQKLGEARRSGWAVFGRRKDDGWLDDVIRQFDDLRAAAGPRPDTSRFAGQARKLCADVAGLLREAGPDWPPARLATMAAKLGPDWLNRLEEDARHAPYLLAELGTAATGPRTAHWLLGRVVLGGVAATPERSDAPADARDPAAATREAAARLDRPAVREAVEKLAAAAAAAADPAEPLLALLDAMLPPPADAEAADALLDRLRSWATGLGFEVRPAGWSYRLKPPFGTAILDGGTSFAYFHKDIPRGTPYRLLSFGLRHGDAVVRPAGVAVSAGPPPEDFGELVALVRGQTAVPGTTGLADGLHRWQQAALDGTLENVAVQFFVEYWGQLGRPLREHAPALAADFARLLAGVLRKAFGLQAFAPTRFDEHPAGWAEVTPGSPGRTGRVRTVLRPGLLDGQGCLRVPALVEVE